MKGTKTQRSSIAAVEKQMLMTLIKEIENRGNNRYDISGNKKDQISPPTSSLFIDNMNRLSNDKEFSDMVISYFNNPSGKHNNNESTDKHNNNNGGSESASFPDITDVGAINNRDKNGVWFCHN